MYKVTLRLCGMALGEWSSDSLSEALGDYLVITQLWFDSPFGGFLPDVDIEVTA